MQLCNSCSGDWLLLLSVFSGLIQVVECCQILCVLQKPCSWVMPTWWPFWKSLLGIFKCLFLDHPHFSRTCIKSRPGLGVGSHGTHSLPLFRIARMSVFTMFYILPSFSPGPLPLPLCYLPVWGVTLVCCLFLIVVWVHISLMARWAVAMFLFLIGRCVSSLQQCDLKTIAYFQRFILLFYLWISVWVRVRHVHTGVLRDQKKVPDSFLELEL